MRSRRRRTYSFNYPKTGGTAGGRGRDKQRPPRTKNGKTDRDVIRRFINTLKPGDRASLINKNLPYGTVKKKFKRRNKPRVVMLNQENFNKKPGTMVTKGKGPKGKNLIRVDEPIFPKVVADLKRRQILPKSYGMGAARVIPIPPTPGGTSRIPKAEAFMETETVSGAGVPTAGGLIGKVQHGKYIQCGKPSSATVKRLAKNNGVHKAVMFDTKFATTNNSDYNHSHGFNCKTYWIPPAAAYVNQSDVEKEVGSSQLGIIRSSKAKETFYASVISGKQIMTLHNQNVSLPIKVKVHWVRMDDKMSGLNPVQRLATAMFHNDITAVPDDVALREKIPQAYQFSNLTNVGDEGVFRSYEVQTSTKINPFVSSPAFKSQFTHVRTVTKVLQPGDTWSVHLTTHCGSGINLTETRADTGTINNLQGVRSLQPVSYMPVIETHGFTVEGVKIGPIGGQTNSTYLGTAPGWWKAEFKKEISYVKSALDVRDITDDVTARSGCHLRVFTKDDNYLNGVSEVFGLPGNIGSSASNIENNWFIPVVRDHEVSWASPRHTSADNSTGN